MIFFIRIALSWYVFARYVSSCVNSECGACVHVLVCVCVCLWYTLFMYIFVTFWLHFCCCRFDFTFCVFNYRIYYLIYICIVSIDNATLQPTPSLYRFVCFSSFSSISFVSSMAVLCCVWQYFRLERFFVAAIISVDTVSSRRLIFMDASVMCFCQCRYNV